MLLKMGSYHAVLSLKIDNSISNCISIIVALFIASANSLIWELTDKKQFHIWDLISYQWFLDTGVKNPANMKTYTMLLVFAKTKICRII